MASLSRALSFIALSGLIASAASTWSACSSTDDASGASGPDAATADTGPTPDAGEPSDAADAAFVTADHPAWPVLAVNTGRLLQPLTLVTIVAANDDLSSSLFAFSDALIASAWWTATSSEYELTKPAASVHVTGPAITTSPDRAGLVQYISDAIDSSGAPAPNGKTLYLVYLPTGITLTAGTSSEYYFHSSFAKDDAGIGDAFAFVARLTSTPGETQLDTITKIASSEIIGAATDPGVASWRLPAITATPWTGSVWSALSTSAVEVGSLCGGTRIREPLAQTGSLYQRSWSVGAALAGGDPCVPARAVPYINVSAPKQWYAGAAGTSVTIPFTGWSTAATTPWLLNVGVANGTTVFGTLKLGTGLTIATPLGSEVMPTCDPRQAINNGIAGTLTVDIPATAVSGDYAALTFRSFREGVACEEDPSDDLDHLWPVGVYVP